VDSAVDIAKESSTSSCWRTACWYWSRRVEGRVFGNIIKYIRWRPARISAICSASWGQRVPAFLPMLPIQVLTNNLLYDFSQTTIPPTRWMRLADPAAPVENWQATAFYSVIGPISSIFDY